MDLIALRDALDGGALDTLCDTVIREGSNAGLLDILHAEDEAITKRWRPISVDDFFDAIAGETLTTAQEERVRTYTLNRSTVPVHKSGVQAWLQANISGAIPAIKALSEVPGRPVDTFLGDDEERIGRREIREVVAQIAKSHVRQPNAPDNSARGDLINGCGVKIRSLRGNMESQAYVDFRNSLYKIHGTDQADTDAQRVAAIDAKVLEVLG